MESAFRRAFHSRSFPWEFGDVFIAEILEAKIPGFFLLHLPEPKFALSAFEHMLIVSARREFLPPETALFQSMEGVFVALFVPKCG